MPPSTIEFFNHILDEITFCLEATSDTTYDEFMSNGMLQRAVVRSLEIIGEAVKKIPKDLTLKYPIVEWKAMAGMRDRLIHNYFGVDYEVVFNTIKQDLPLLQESIHIIIEQERK